MWVGPSVSRIGRRDVYVCHVFILQESSSDLSLGVFGRYSLLRSKHAILFFFINFTLFVELSTSRTLCEWFQIYKFLFRYL